MKTLLESIKDSIMNPEQQIESWIKDNTDSRTSVKFTIKNIHNKYVVNADSIDFNGSKITNLTNGDFVWGKVNFFRVANCQELVSLEGAPQECGEFYCNDCNKIKDVKGCENMNGVDLSKFCIQNCKNLKSLKGCPEKCSRFICNGNKSLKSIDGMPKRCSYIDLTENGKQFDENEIFDVCPCREIYV